MTETAVYDDLVSARSVLRDHWKNRTGKARVICADEALREMARLMPRKPADFSLIDGLGKTFIDNYSRDFLKVLDSHREEYRGNEVELDDAVVCRLQELEKKLINISRGNRLLFMPRATNPKESFDLAVSPIADGAKDVIFRKEARTTLAAGGTDGYRKLSQLHRNINRIIRDKGQNDLYVGYLFAEGCLPGERFDIKAPLVLFPVELVRTPERMDLRFDDSRDIVFNNTLILGYYKVNGISRPLPENILDEAGEDGFIDTVLGFYGKAGLDLKRCDDVSEPFVNYKSGTFPEYPLGDIRMCNNMVLGRFPTYSSSIQKDFADIVNGRMVNPLIRDLMTGCSGDHEEHQVRERDISYINDLNSAQEKALDALHDGDRLVIQGPPGTGKSQTIASIIADFASRGKTVLMVSEKKAALDVVYSRLGVLSKYAVLIDDVNDKASFFDQIDAMTRLPQDIAAPDASSISSEIESRFGILDDISTTLYSPAVLGAEPYLLYTGLPRPDPSDRRQRNKYAELTGMIPRRMMDHGYGELCGIHERFRKRSLVTDINDCMQMRTQHPWLMDVRPDLSDFESEIAMHDLADLRKEIESWKNGGFFTKVMNKTRMKERVEEVMSKYWTYYRCIDPAYTYAELDEYIQGLAHFDEYSSVNSIYESLSDCGKMYAEALTKLSDSDLCSPNLANEELFSFLSLQHLYRFESANGEIMRDIASFESVLDDIGSLMKAKEQETIQTTESKLAHCLSEITGSKRYPEMRRILDMKRKWNVSKFVGRFDYELFKGVRIWLLTPDVVSEILPLESGLFDLVVFDEASQMFLERGIPSVMRAKRTVIAGDHMQLRPSKLGVGRIGLDEDDAESEGLDTIQSDSLLDSARMGYPSVMLRNHYRSAYADLIAFSNHAFYGGDLHVSPDLESDPEPPIQVHMVKNGHWKDRCNRPEAERVVDLLSDILRNKGGETVGIITFNSTQMDLIESLIEDRCAADPVFCKLYRAEADRKRDGEDVGLFVKNIENVQGDERDIIVFSVGYARGDNGRLVRNFGWLNQSGGENRLNVAISRARTRIHVVTSFEPSELTVDDMKNKGPKLLRMYLQYCFAVSSGDRRTAEGILGSLSDGRRANTTAEDTRFSDSVFNALRSKGLDVVRDVGVGDYTIDVAIRRNGRFVLGIECDGPLYHSGMDTRERDYHRRRYLESRGWNMCRAWSPRWWKDPDGEAERIVSMIEGKGEEVHIPKYTHIATATTMCMAAKM